MHKRIEGWGWNFYVSLNKVQQTIGVNNKLGDGQFFPLWDFDEHGTDYVVEQLLKTQREFSLPTIYVLQSSDTQHHHAFSFQRLSWHECVKAIGWPEGVDRQFYGLGALRGHYTLRIQDKDGYSTTLVQTLYSPRAETIDPMEVRSFAKYWTKRS